MHPLILPQHCNSWGFNGVLLFFLDYQKYLLSIVVNQLIYEKVMDISKRVNVTFLWAIRSHLMPRIKNIKSKQISPGAGEIYRKILVLLIQAKCSWGLIIASFSLWIWVRPSLKISRRWWNLQENSRFVNSSEMFIGSNYCVFFIVNLSKAFIEGFQTRVGYCLSWRCREARSWSDPICQSCHISKGGIFAENVLRNTLKYIFQQNLKQIMHFLADLNNT